jgi:ABC-type lipoprotein export system ATPase subunit
LFRLGTTRIDVLRDVSFEIRPGEFVAIEGRSGSGKSTLLHLIGALDRPDSGSIEIGGRDLSTLSTSARSRLRNRQIGFVFQFYHLLPELNVLQNIMLAASVDGWWWTHRARVRTLLDRASELAERMGLQDRLRHRPSELSGGERQRVAIARALMNQPRLLLADEPTGNLDSQTGGQITGMIERLHREQRQTIVMVTHDRTWARQADRVLVLKDGTLVDQPSVDQHSVDRPS